MIDITIWQEFPPFCVSIRFVKIDPANGKLPIKCINRPFRDRLIMITSNYMIPRGTYYNNELIIMAAREYSRIDFQLITMICKHL